MVVEGLLSIREFLIVELFTPKVALPGVFTIAVLFIS
jgi:hypothetical protein